ncbi:MAG TPA: glycosyltransferase family 2 protein [Trichormus sp.]
MSEPRVSIVIVNWKTPKLLARCLDSILADARAGEFEIIVVDNASDDGSVELLRDSYSCVRTVANTENVGFSRACNQVIPQAKGRFIFLLNPDTLVVDNAVSKLADFMDVHSDCGAAGPKVLNPDRSLQLACRRAFPTPEAAFYRLTYLSRLFPNHPKFSKYNLTHADPNQELEVDALSGSAMMVRREVVEQIGLLDEDIFMFGEDIDWCWRIKQAKWKVFYTPDPVVIHEHGAASRLRPVGTTINLHKGMEVFYKKHLAQKYWAPFNALVYTAIWTRAALFILVNVARAATATGRYS